MALTLDGTAGITFPVTAGSASAVQASSGRVLQVVQTSSNSQSSTASGTFTDTGLSATITPSSSTSKILILVCQNFYVDGGGLDSGGSTCIVRNSTIVYGASSSNSFYISIGSGTGNSAVSMYIPMNYLDSPATTSAVTYKTQMRAEDAATIYTIINNNTSTITLMEIAA